MTKPADFVQWLDELVTALLVLENKNKSKANAAAASHSMTKVNLMGHSYGGWQCALYAAAHPDRVHRMVLLAPLGVRRPRPQVLLRAVLYYFFPTRSVVRRYLHWHAPVAVQRNAATVDDMAEDTVLAFRCYKRRGFVPPTLLTKSNCCYNAQNNNSAPPTLFLVGDHEVTYSAEKAIRHLAKVAPHVRSVMVADADHHLALVQPEFVNTAVQRFLNE